MMIKEYIDDNGIERKVFYVDTGDMTEDMVINHIEKVKSELEEKRK